jgi:alcohol dehydrogenase
MTSPFEFILPTRIRYGAGAAASLGEEALKLGASRVMVVTDPGLLASGALKAALASLEEAFGAPGDAGARLAVYDGVGANPKDFQVEECAARAREFGAGALVAIGGGSPIDAAKAASALALQGGRARDLQGGPGKVTGACLPLIAVPTTAGTGSEVTFSAVVTDTAERVKFTVKCPAIAPKVAVLDPELTLTLPPSVTAATGMDALTHAVEGCSATCAEPIAEALGLHAAGLIAGAVGDAVRDGGDVSARDRMLMGSLLAGMCFSHSDVASVHCMAEALGSLYDAPHGLCNAILLPTVMEHNLPYAQGAYARVARAMGVAEPDDAAAAREAVALVRALSRSVSLPGMEAVGVKAEDIPRLAELATRNGSNASNPVPVTLAGYIALFEKACQG